MVEQDIKQYALWLAEQYGLKVQVVETMRKGETTEMEQAAHALSQQGCYTPCATSISSC